jgi:hypothetical protein
MMLVEFVVVVVVGVVLVVVVLLSHYDVQIYQRCFVGRCCGGDHCDGSVLSVAVVKVVQL